MEIWVFLFFSSSLNICRVKVGIVRAKHLENVFFPGQGKVRDFGGGLRKLGKDLFKKFREKSRSLKIRSLKINGFNRL